MYFVNVFYFTFLNVHQFGRLPFRWPHTRLIMALIQLPEIAHDFPRPFVFVSLSLVFFLP